MRGDRRPGPPAFTRQLPVCYKDSGLPLETLARQADGLDLNRYLPMAR